MLKVAGGADVFVSCEFISMLPALGKAGMNLENGSHRALKELVMMTR